MDVTDGHLELSIVVPVYRSATILPVLVQQIQEAMAAEGLSGAFEIVLVHDAGPDNSWQVIHSLAVAHGFARGINLRKNVGQHNATIAGLNHVRGRIVAIMDDDLQHPPAALGEMMRALDRACPRFFVNGPMAGNGRQAWRRGRD